MGYEPNAVARSLIGRRTHTLDVVTSGLEYFGPSSTLTGIEKQASTVRLFSRLIDAWHGPDRHPGVGLATARASGPQELNRPGARAAHVILRILSLLRRY
ncbi:MAG: hypothetical protein NVSMB52_10900 [Chloroflexota bacterium]